MEQAGVVMSRSKDMEVQTTKLLNKSFLFTGKLSKPRKEYEQLVIQNGGKMVYSVSSSLSYLVVGENSGDKLKQAHDKGISCINEQEFMNLLS